jgi:hypothetical protein
MIRFLLSFIPFAGPISVLAGFLPRLLHLKREKAVHREAGEAFPQPFQAEIDAHTVRTQVAGWRLAAGVMTATSLGLGFLWYGATLKNDEYKAVAENNEEARKVAMKERDTWYKSYTEQNAEIVNLRARISEESIKRQGIIVAEAKQKGITRRKKIEAERKVAASQPIDPADILRIESIAGSDFAATSGIPDAASLQTGGSVGNAP